MAIQKAARHSHRAVPAVRDPVAAARARPIPATAARLISAAGAPLVPAVAAVLLLGGCGGSPQGAASTGSAGPATSADRAGMSRIPEATTFATVSGAPKDTAPGRATDGLVVRPDGPVAVFDRPGGRPVATLPAEQLGGPTWVPVVESSGNWRRVLLPSKPNGSSGWISGSGLSTARTPYTVRVDLAKRRLTLLKSARKAGQWTVAIGGPKTPTPQGRTFIMATLAPAKKTPSPLVLPLGTHSATLDTFGGGPGTVALHGWPDTSVFGKAVTHGCVRVPKDALRTLSRVPLGSLVLITA
ncbi:murein L,D-transpeptidase [Actinomadura sp. KC06]|uniref:L,D-transpeptidase n=1 Tax=Actinomadura sp. KC06 TaxID=2530369 RepID=UPI001050DBF3|nr:L,D-transpeptidase [Actinomadura sp. KC06]TDD30168.1 murein L,D-transpeptidase [Actinomadura sp. KC06]